MRIVVLGGGFGGVATTRHLEHLSRTRADIDLTLVSRQNFFIVTPLLFEACAGRQGLGTMASLGHTRAVARVFGLRLTGFAACGTRGRDATNACRRASAERLTEAPGDLNGRATRSPATSVPRAMRHRTRHGSAAGVRGAARRGASPPRGAAPPAKTESL